MGSYAGVTRTIPYLRLESEVSSLPPIINNYKGKRMGWGRSLLLVGHICICVLSSNFYNRFFHINIS
jgi:hypothetical protein